jgi:hypothetical protein
MASDTLVWAIYTWTWAKPAGVTFPIPVWAKPAD